MSSFCAKNTEHLRDTIENVCEQAMTEGQKIDLTDCYYGKPHWDGPFVSSPYAYYFFLAGFVKVQKLSQILEIGTHFGGSILSMNRGMSKQDGSGNRLVTVDITCENKEAFKPYPRIKRIQGDSLDPKTLTEIATSFKGPIDLLFIDAVHECSHVKRNISIYANLLSPKYIILDDIHLNDSMRELWKEVQKEFKDRAFDVTSISGRGEDVGFGIIHCTRPFKWIKHYDLFKRTCSFLRKLLKPASRRSTALLLLAASLLLF